VDYHIPLGTYLELEYAGPEAKAKMIREIVSAHSKEAIRLPALDKGDIDSFIETATAIEQANIVERFLDRVPEDKVDDFLGGPPYLSKLDKLLTALGYRDGMRCNLENASLNGITLDGAVLSGVNLRNSSLQGAIFRNVNLVGADLQEADLRGATLQGKGTLLMNASFKKADLSYAVLEDLENDNFLRTRRQRRAFDQVEEDLQAALVAELSGYPGSSTESLIGKLRGYFSTDYHELSEELSKSIDSFRKKHGNELTPLSYDYLGELLQRGVHRDTEYLEATNFDDACLRYARLENADLSSCAIGRIYIGGSWLSGTRIKQEQFAVSNGERLDVIGEELDARVTRNTIDLGSEAKEERIKGFLFADEDVREELRKADKKRTHNRDSGRSDRHRAVFFSEARDGYRTLKRNFASLGEDEAASWAYLRERRMEKRQAYHERRFGKWLKDWCMEVVCNYGEGPWRSLAWVGITLAFFAVFYSLTGVVGASGNPSDTEHVYGMTALTDWCVSESLQNREHGAALHRSAEELALFSLGSMTTMVPEGLDLRCAWFQFVPRLQALVAIALTGLLGFVLGNRIRRR
jgi:uncharacterized protein YjbI with pentapeptide repeats